MAKRRNNIVFVYQDRKRTALKQKVKICYCFARREGALQECSEKLFLFCQNILGVNKKWKIVCVICHVQN